VAGRGAAGSEGKTVVVPVLKAPPVVKLPEPAKKGMPGAEGNETVAGGM
jgi:hypothetical protein